MPRLRKETIDKIEELIRQGYIDVEICAKTSVSRPTVRKIRRSMDSTKGRKECAKSVETETLGKETVIAIGEGKDGERVEFLDLKGKKLRFVDVVGEFLINSGLFSIEKSTLKSVLFEMFSSEIDELKECFLATMSARLIEEFKCVECSSKKSVIPVRCAKCGHEYLWGSKPEYTSVEKIER